MCVAGWVCFGGGCMLAAVAGVSGLGRGDGKCWVFRLADVE